MPELSQIPLTYIIVLFVAAAAVIAVAGWRLASQADRLADVTGMGEALAGALLLGAATSLPGILTSAVTAWEGLAELAVSNALGGIAAQTVFLAIADITYRKINLEHAAASVSNVLQCTLLIFLLSIPLVAASVPQITFWGINLFSLALPIVYISSLHMIYSAERLPTWQPQMTPETREDVPETDSEDTNVPRLWGAFFLTAVIVGLSGWIVAKTGIELTNRTGLSQSAVGGVFTAVATSLPELVTVIAAVRQGALTLAVGDIIGGNSFDVLFIAVADVAYRDGSIYHAIKQHQYFLFALVIMMSAILAMGLLRREKKGIANIGFESVLMLALYAGGILYLFM